MPYYQLPCSGPMLPNQPPRCPPKHKGRFSIPAYVLKANQPAEFSARPFPKYNFLYPSHYAAPWDIQKPVNIRPNLPKFAFSCRHPIKLPLGCFRAKIRACGVSLSGLPISNRGCVRSGTLPLAALPCKVTFQIEPLKDELRIIAVRISDSGILGIPAAGKEKNSRRACPFSFYYSWFWDVLRTFGCNVANARYACRTDEGLHARVNHVSKPHTYQFVSFRESHFKCNCIACIPGNVKFC